MITGATSLRMHWAALSVSCALLWAAASSAAKGGDDAAKPADGWAVTPLLPPETLFVVSVTDAQKAVGKLKQTGLWQIYSNADIQRTFRAPLMMAQGAITAAELQGGFKVDDILSFFSQGEVTFALLGLEKRTAQGQPVPEMVLSTQARGTVTAAMDEITKRLDQLKAAAALNAGQVTATQTPVGNTVVNRLTVLIPEMPNGQLILEYASCDGNVLAAVGEGRLQKLLAMHEKYKAAPPKPAAAGEATEVLAQNPAFQKMLQKGGPDTDLVLYVNVEAILKNPLLDAKPKTDQQRREWDAIGVASIKGVAYCVGAKDKGIHETFFINAPAAERKGLLAMVEGEGLPADALTAAPRNALVAGAVKIAPEKMFDKLVELAALENPNAKQDVGAWLLAVGQQLNLDIRKEVFGALTGQAVFSVSFVARHPKLPIGFPQPILTLGIKDVTALKNVLKALKAAGKDSHDFTELVCGEREIVVARERFVEGRDPGQIAYAVDGTDLLVSLYPLALREEMNRRAAVAKNQAGSTLADDKDFKAARAAVSVSPQALLYVDTGALAVALYDLLIPVAQLTQRIPQVDVTALPTSEVLFQNLGGAVFGLSADADGIAMEGYSPTGGVSLLAIIPAAMGGRRIAGAQIRRVANRQQQVFEQVGRDLKAFAQENGGKYPATLKEMQPKYLANVGAELGDVVYRGAQDAGNKIVAHSSEKRMGPITILTQDGTVALIRRQVLGRALRDGYKPGDEAGPGQQQPAPDAGGDAVKPPRPPEF